MTEVLPPDPETLIFMELEALLESEPEALLKPGEVALLFRVSPKTVSRWSEEGRIASVRTLGGHRRFSSKEVSRVRASILPIRGPEASLRP